MKYSSFLNCDLSKTPNYYIKLKHGASRKNTRWVLKMWPCYSAHSTTELVIPEKVNIGTKFLNMFHRKIFNKINFQYCRGGLTVTVLNKINIVHRIEFVKWKL